MEFDHVIWFLVDGKRSKALSNLHFDDMLVDDTIVTRNGNFLWLWIQFDYQLRCRLFGNIIGKNIISCIFLYIFLVQYPPTTQQYIVYMALCEAGMP